MAARIALAGSIEAAANTELALSIAVEDTAVGHNQAYMRFGNIAAVAAAILLQRIVMIS